MAVLYANNATTTLSASITNSATSLSVASGKGALFPAITGSDYFYITLTNSAGAMEIAKVTARSTDTFTITRGQDGTTGLAWAAGDKVDLRITKSMLDDLKGERMPVYGPSVGSGGRVMINMSGNPAWSDANFTYDVIMGQFRATSFRANVGDSAPTWNFNNILHAGNYTSYSPSLTGSGASGTWGISITGTAAQLGSKADTAFVYGGANSASNSLSATQNVYELGQYKSGFWDVYGAAWMPNADWWWGATFAHTSNNGAYNYSGQLAFSNGGGGNSVYARTISNGTATGWALLLSSGNFSTYAAPASHTHAYLPLSGGTMSGIITTVSTGTALNFSGQSDSFGYNATAGLGTYIKGTGNVYIYGGGKFYDGSTAQTLLHTGNYTSYSPSLTGSGASGTWGISITGNAATVTNGLTTSNYSSYALPLGGGTVTGATTFNAGSLTNQSHITLGPSTTYNITQMTNLNAGAYLGGAAAGDSAIFANTSTTGLVVGKHNGGWIRFSSVANMSTGATVAGNVILHAGNYTSYSPSLTGSGASGTWGITVSGYAYGLSVLDTDRTIANRLPTSTGQSVRFDFANANAVGTGGNYAGVMTFSPWTGTTASTGDASYQLVFGSTAANGGGNPLLRLRKGIDSTWNSWVDVLTSANYTSYVSGAQYFGTAATKAIAYNSNTISENITITAGNNGLSAGPVTVSTGYTVTVATGASWSVV